MDAEALYRQLGRIIETAPDFTGYEPLTHDHLLWIGRAHALVRASGDSSAQLEFELASRGVQGALRHDAIKQLTLVLYKVLGTAELRRPVLGVRSYLPATVSTHLRLSLRCC